LESPVNGSAQTTLTVQFKWSNPTGETKLTLEVSVNSGSFVSPLAYGVDLDADTTVHTAPAGVLSPNTTYYWRVVAKNGSNTVASNADFSFSCPKPSSFTLSGPSNGQTGVSTSATLTWNPSSNATSYEVTVSANSGLNPPLSGFPKTGTSTNTTVSGLSANTTYYWTVVAKNGNGDTTATQQFSFTTDSGGTNPGLGGGGDSQSQGQGESGR
jgi:hypothetical protein